MESQEVPREKRPVSEVIERLWGQALVGVERAEDAAQGTLHRVAGLVGWSQEEVRRHAREFADRMSGQRETLQRYVEEGVQRALGRMRVPRREDVQGLSARLDRVAERLARLERPE